MKDLIMRGADVKYQPAHDFSFLSHLTIFESSYACNLKKMAIALECGADVNGGQGYYGGPLFYAITSALLIKSSYSWVINQHVNGYMKLLKNVT